MWKNYQNYRRVKAQNAVVTDLKHLAAFENRRMDDGAFRFIYPHLKGLLFKMNGIGAGAYFFIKDVHIAKR